MKNALLKIATILKRAASTPSKPMSLPDPVPINPANINQYELLAQEADQPIQSKATNPTSPTIIQQPNQLESNMLNGNSTSENPSTVKQIVTTAIHEALQPKPKKKSKKSAKSNKYNLHSKSTPYHSSPYPTFNQQYAPAPRVPFNQQSYPAPVQRVPLYNPFIPAPTPLQYFRPTSYAIAISLCNTYKPNNSSACHKSITSLMKTANE